MNELLTACRPLQMDPPCKAVLMCLADRANDWGVCWPSFPSICEYTCYGRTAVIESIAWLEKMELIVVKRGSGNSNRYSLSLAVIEKAAEDPFWKSRPRKPHSNRGLGSAPRERVAVRAADGSSSPGGPKASIPPSSTTQHQKLLVPLRGRAEEQLSRADFELYAAAPWLRDLERRMRADGMV